MQDRLGDNPFFEKRKYGATVRISSVWMLKGL
jgi:hypothetical protein